MPQMYVYIPIHIILSDVLKAPGPYPCYLLSVHSYLPTPQFLSFCYYLNIPGEIVARRNPPE